MATMAMYLRKQPVAPNPASCRTIPFTVLSTDKQNSSVHNSIDSCSISPSLDTLVLKWS